MYVGGNAQAVVLQSRTVWTPPRTGAPSQHDLHNQPSQAGCRRPICVLCRHPRVVLPPPSPAAGCRRFISCLDTVRRCEEPRRFSREQWPGWRTLPNDGDERRPASVSACAQHRRGRGGGDGLALELGGVLWESM